MRSKLIVTALLSIIGFAACRKGNKLSKTPALTFVSSTSEVKAGSSADTVSISFRLEDGDADVRTDGGEPNLFISNTRDTNKFDYPLPEIPDQFKDPTIGLRATCLVRIPAAFLLLRDTSMAKDSLQFKLSLQDEAGNRSNEIVTPQIYLLK